MSLPQPTYVGESAERRPRPLRAYISSTVLELPEHRARVREACLIADVLPIGMEHLPPRDQTAVADMIEMVDMADIFIGIYAFRYGWVPEGRDVSIIEMEFDRAVKRKEKGKLPAILIFTASEEHNLSVRDIEADKVAQEKLHKFKERVAEGGAITEFKSAKELRDLVLRGLLLFKEEQQRVADTEAPATKESKAQSRKETPEPDMPPDVTPLHLDNPADADYLGRRGFAAALAVRLNRVWEECNRPGQRTEARSSFVLHLHGPWGSGKTSLLNFLKKELQPARDEKVGATESRGWVVVEFNAWQHQRISPPWWPLLESVSKQAARQTREVFGEPFGALRLRWREWWWRFSRGR